MTPSQNSQSNHTPSQITYSPSNRPVKSPTLSNEHNAYASSGNFCTPKPCITYPYLITIPPHLYLIIISIFPPSVSLHDPTHIQSFQIGKGNITEAGSGGHENLLICDRAPV